MELNQKNEVIMKRLLVLAIVLFGMQLNASAPCLGKNKRANTALVSSLAHAPGEATTQSEASEDEGDTSGLPASAPRKMPRANATTAAPVLMKPSISLLHAAVFKGNKIEVRVIINALKKAVGQDNAGKQELYEYLTRPLAGVTVLHQATYQGDVEMVREILSGIEDAEMQEAYLSIPAQDTCVTARKLALVMHPLNLELINLLTSKKYKRARRTAARSTRAAPAPSAPQAEDKPGTCVIC